MLWVQLLASAVIVSRVVSFSTSHVMHEKRTVSLPHKKQRVDGEAIVPVRIALRQNNLDVGYEKLSKNTRFYWLFFCLP
jgi:tripeptidyl-peptidase-1